MDDRLLIIILQYERQLSAFHERCEKIGVTIEWNPKPDLLDAVLDEIGVPIDRTARVPYDQIHTVFCRDWAYTLFDDIVVDGTEEQCKKYLAIIRRDIADDSHSR